jgi:hypothetical protein
MMMLCSTRPKFNCPKLGRGHRRPNARPPRYELDPQRWFAFVPKDLLKWLKDPQSMQRDAILGRVTMTSMNVRSEEAASHDIAASDLTVAANP